MITIKYGNLKGEEYLCKSIVIGDTEYVAEYSSSEWYYKNINGNKENPKVRLPNNEDGILKDEFSKRFIDGDEILV